MNWPMAFCYCVTIVCLAISFEVWIKRNHPIEEKKEEWRTRTGYDNGED